jgi:hypothetical protein
LFADGAGRISFISRGEGNRSFVGMPLSFELIVVTDTPHFEVRTSIHVEASSEPSTSGTAKLLLIPDAEPGKGDSAFESRGVDFLEFK